MTLLVIAIILATAFATYLSALNLSLMGMSRAALQDKLSEQGRPSAADWLLDQTDSAMLATAFCRTLARMSIYVLILAALIGLGAQATTITWGSLILAGLIAAVVIWFSTIVLATALARHFSSRLIASNLPMLRTLTLICSPATKAGLVVDGIFRRLSGSKGRKEGETELLQSIQDVQREGNLDIQSAELLENVVEFTNTEVSQIMTPRAEIEGIEFTDSFSVIRPFIEHARHSRIPVFRDNVDNIVGILYLKDLIPYLGEDATAFKLASVLRQPIVVPETKPVRELLSVFQRSEVHMAIVIDEFGSTAGLVTIEDVLEEIVGDIRDEHEAEQDHPRSFHALDDLRAEVDGRFRIDELNAHLPLNLPENGDYDTVAGFVLAHMGRMPSVGEKFETHNARFTALEATPTHLQRVGIELLPRPTFDADGMPK
ncbi:MAG: hemolysin family protein [Phycisphaerales bacterium]|nr:hemolysin family protein [Phycisphaerales bacterium]MCI0630787.1 hemolysin family protein [Phycisphaerales bacterium]MCI0674211.1 hemolysin family protein [Phycisphaerales bacterium]